MNHELENDRSHQELNRLKNLADLTWSFPCLRLHLLVDDMHNPGDFCFQSLVLFSEFMNT